MFLGHVPSYDKVFIFRWLHIEIGSFVEGIDSESAKVQNVLNLLIKSFLML